MIRLTAQISVPGRIPLGPQTGGGGGEQEPVWVLSSYGHTIDDALLNLQQELADELFLGHLRIIVVNEKLAKKALNDLMITCVVNQKSDGPLGWLFRKRRHQNIWK